MNKTKMNKEEIFEILKPLIEDSLSVGPEKITLEAIFKDDLDVDSLDQVELMMTIEKKFDVAFTDEEMEKVTTVQQAVDMIHGRL